VVEIVAAEEGVASVVTEVGEMVPFEARTVEAVEASIVEEAFSVVDQVGAEVTQQLKYIGKS
jgi:hypothetical protein